MDFGNGVTLLISVQKGRPVGSSGYVQLRYAAVTTWADAQIARWTIYTEIDEARAVAERLAHERADG